MKVVQINTVCGTGSTGRICVGISKALSECGIENYIISSSKSTYQLSINCGCGKAYKKFQALKSRIIGNYGFNSQTETKRIIRELDRIRPDIVQLHNIHGHDCNIKMLFDYFKKQGIRVIWTFHDCWAFTGYCPHFSMENCSKWQDDCAACPKKNKYSWFFDRSHELYIQKKELFNAIDLTIVVPSNWMKGLVKKSFLSDCPILVINNGVDQNVFKKTRSNFRKLYGVSPKKIVLLGVADGWSRQKGLDVINELSQRLDSDEYQIVLVGTDKKTDLLLGGGIISIHRTDNQKQLAEIYSAADLFINPSLEDTYPTVNMEAISCGTPVVAFNLGGGPEIIGEACGMSVEANDVNQFIDAITQCVNKKELLRVACLARSKAFKAKEKYLSYVHVYQNLMGINS